MTNVNLGVEEAKVSPNRKDQIVVIIVLFSAAVSIVTALSVYYLIMMHASWMVWRHHWSWDRNDYRLCDVLHSIVLVW